MQDEEWCAAAGHCSKVVLLQREGDGEGFLVLELKITCTIQAPTNGYHTVPALSDLILTHRQASESVVLSYEEHLLLVKVRVQEQGNLKHRQKVARTPPGALSVHEPVEWGQHTLRNYYN
jgi:hypothetical protein